MDNNKHNSNPIITGKINEYIPEWKFETHSTFIDELTGEVLKYKSKKEIKNKYGTIKLIESKKIIEFNTYKKYNMYLCKNKQNNLFE